MTTVKKIEKKKKNRRGCSSVWLERQSVTLEAASSSLVNPA